MTAVETKTPRRLRLKDASKVPLEMWTDPEPDMKAIERAVKAGHDLGDAVEWEPGKRSIRIQQFSLAVSLHRHHRAS